MEITMIYGSDGGNTEDIATQIADKLDATVKSIDVSKATADDFTQAQNLILGTSTWGEGDLQSDWEDFIDELDSIDFSGKKVALFGLGDQDGYGDSFVGAMSLLYEKVKEKGATIVGGGVSTDGYDFEESEAVIDGTFVGLPIDEDNQSDLTEERIDNWTTQIQKEFA